MLGGGTFVTQNKTLPGAYINFVSATTNSNGMSARGIGAMCFSSDWLAQGAVTEITAEDFLTNSTKILGHDYGDDSMLVLREFFKKFTFHYELIITKKDLCCVAIVFAITISK